MRPLRTAVNDDRYTAPFVCGRVRRGAGVSMT